jgi:hypothetical protein
MDDAMFARSRDGKNRKYSDNNHNMKGGKE